VLEIDDADVIALFCALIERYQNSGEQAKALEVCADALTRLAAACQKSAEEVKALEDMRREVYGLTFDYSNADTLPTPDSSPAPEDRIRQIRTITFPRLP